MQVKLRVVGSNALFQKISSKFNATNAACLKLSEKEGIAWQVAYASDRLCPEDFLCFPDLPNVILIQATKTELLRRIEVMRSQIYATARSNGNIPLVLAPVAVIFDPDALRGGIAEMPEFVSEWLNSETGAEEWIHRILFCLRKQKILKRELRFGSITLIPELHSVSYDSETVRLSPSEYALADFFFRKLGSTVRSEELSAFFTAQGKSADSNNIRVAIYQLRLKLEKLTRSQLRIESIYKQGYSLRYSSSHERRPPVASKRTSPQDSRTEPKNASLHLETA